MRVDVSFKNLGKNEVLESTIEKNIKKVEKRIRLFKKEDPIHLSLHLEKNPHKECYVCWINLYLPFKVLKAQHTSDSNTCSAINATFSAILKQLDKLKHKLETHLRKKNEEVVTFCLIREERQVFLLWGRG